MIYLDETQIGQSHLLDKMELRIDWLNELDLIEKLKPKFSKDGNQFCYLYGNNLQSGIAGYGETVGEAVSDFYKEFHSSKAK